VWWKNTPELDGQRIGYVGHFAVSESRAAAPMLEWACEQLAKEGCSRAVGPIDGSTWQRYRLITERGDEPPYLLEPDNPDDWPGHFAAAGFTPLAHYYSALNPDLSADPRLPGLAQKLHDADFVLRPFDPERFDDELRRVHALSLVSFRNNFLYSPISEADFLEQYRAVRQYLRPDLCVLAEKRGELAGFMFTFPNLLQAQRGRSVDTVILKTLAVHPDHSGIGLGTLLLGRSQEAARQAGFKRAIHALMHESNFSGRISSHVAKVFRRYTLFARPLNRMADHE
jgi:GNAT superfamily N-acetyltransferase